ncbi:MAG: transcriptional repressor [Alphaproteobacteria bacterium]|nr:transcriptional repressor [Alphaproteobacteria bacterium]
MDDERTRDRLVELLRGAALRVTQARVEVLAALCAAPRALSHREVSEALPALDQATVFRNLTALADAGLVLRVDLGDHVWRFALAGAPRAVHDHPHFTCTRCGETTCLDEVRVEGPRVDHLMVGADVQIRGTCESCR